MAIQSTPHGETQQNVNPAQDDVEPEQLPQETGRGEDAELYRDSAGAQTGGTRAFNANQFDGPRRNTEPEMVAHTGSVTTRTPQSEDQGITSHSASEESARQRKVVSQRPDATAGLNHNR